MDVIKWKSYNTCNSPIYNRANSYQQLFPFNSTNKLNDAEIEAYLENHPQPFNRDEYLGSYADTHPENTEPYTGYIKELAKNGLKNIGHQLITRLYMDFLRLEGEHNFLALLPEAQRETIKQSWYRKSPPSLSTFFENNREFSQPSGINYQTLTNWNGKNALETS